MRLVIIIAFLFVQLPGFAQEEMTPRDYFNSAAQHFLDGNKRDAIKTLNSGLEAHPGDERMLKLAEELLKEMEQQQQNQQQQQQEQQQNQQNQEKQNGSGGNSDQSQEQNNPGGQEKEGDENRDQSDDQQEGEGKENQGEQGEDQTSAKDPGQQGEQGNQDGEQASGAGSQELPAEAGKLSREQAERMLKSLNQQDKNTKAKVMRAQQGQRKGRSAKPEKDW